MILLDIFTVLPQIIITLAVIVSLLSDIYFGKYLQHISYLITQFFVLLALFFSFQYFIFPILTGFGGCTVSNGFTFIMIHGCGENWIYTKILSIIKMIAWITGAYISMPWMYLLAPCWSPKVMKGLEIINISQTRILRFLLMVHMSKPFYFGQRRESKLLV